MKKYILIIFITLLTIALLLFDPLRRNNKAIERMILKRIPYQTEFDIAKKIIEDSKWSIEYVDMENGYELFDDYGVTIVGEKYMCIYLGAYRNFFITDVSAFLIFDDESKLIQIVIRKDTDGL